MLSTGNRIPSKRMVYTFNEKGGVGKTTCARGLLEIYRKLNINCLAFDADERSAQLHRYYNNNNLPVKKINIFKIGEYDALLNDLHDEEPDVVLVDLPGTSGEAFEQMEKELALFEQARILKYRITMVVVMSRTKDSVDALEKLMEYCSERQQDIDYVAVLNLFFGEDKKFTRWTNSELKKTFERAGGIEIKMPELYEEMYDFIDRENLTFSEAANSSNTTFTNRSRAFRWLEEFEKELKKASSFLGLEFAAESTNEVSAISANSFDASSGSSSATDTSDSLSTTISNAPSDSSAPKALEQPANTKSNKKGR